MKKKVIFSLFVAMLLSFSMMAKSNHTIVKVSHHVNKKYHKAPQKIINTNVDCLVVQLSCMRALACGSTGGGLVRDAIRLEGALCG
jgi:hypothetical protein